MYSAVFFSPHAGLLAHGQDKLALAIANGIFEFLGMEAKTVVETAEQAILKLVQKGIINNPDYWSGACEVVKNLDALLIKFANGI